MASPCEVHVADATRVAAEEIIRAVAAEAGRIEAKYSRYLKGNIVDRINSAAGAPVTVDEETARLLDYAATLFALSGGRFDITSGVLRRAWKFDGSSRLPGRPQVRRLLSRTGWRKVRWNAPTFELPAGMEIDFGGIGKEYAVDRAVQIASDLGGNCLINFGGDLRAQGPGADSSGWVVGIEALRAAEGPEVTISLESGALATSGDAYRFLERAGRRYSHILDPRTGWPVEGAPRSITVCAPTCTDAGMLATLAMLHGADAEVFLETQGMKFWCLR